EDNPEILRPLIFRLTHQANGRRKSTLLSFFDCAGEDWESRSESFRGEAQYMTQASGLLFLVDPLRIEAVASDSRLTLTHKELSARPANYADDIRHLGSFFELKGRKLPSKVPLAVCLNKLDRWGPLMPPGTLLSEVATSVPGASPLPSNLDENVHEEVKAAIERWTGESFSRQLELKFPNHRFFAVSSLGDAAQTDEETPLALPTPLLVDRPILWLLKQQGVLVEDKSTARRAKTSS
ncbi:MAG TPA: hypothetical protein VFT74_01245, partial [Isosphaeraceae bacterium]|nr:hypothetical protein [Isosphaeraceae bacterium]